MVYKAANKDSDEPSMVNEVSFAYCDILCSFSFMTIPFISLFCLSMIARTSAHIMKRYDATRSPCLHPLCTSSCSERKPLCKIDALNLVFEILIHSIIYSPEPKNSRTF